jgi:hypothetical protein
MKNAGHRIPRASRRTAVVGLVALAVSVAGAIVDPTPFFEGWLVSWLFLLGIALGSLVLTMLYELTSGEWGVMLGPIFAGAALTLPLVAMLALPLALALDLFPWTNPDVIAMSETVAAKSWYLNVPGFLARSGASLVLWSALALVFCRPGPPRRRVAVAGLVIYFVTVTFAAVDWIASLVPEWYSTAIGIRLGALQVVGAFAFAVAATVARRPASLAPQLLRDMGALLLTLAMTWAYFAFAQYLVVWGGDLPHETSWYWARSETSWRYLAFTLVSLMFVLPTAAMLFRNVKSNRNRLALVCWIVVLAAWCDTFWLVAPSLRPAGFALHWQDIATLVAQGGLWLAALIALSRRAPRRVPAIEAAPYG